MHGYPDRVYTDLTGATVMEVNLGEYGTITLPRTVHDQVGAESLDPEEYRDRLLDEYRKSLPEHERAGFDARINKADEAILQSGAHTRAERSAVGTGLVGPGTGAPSLEAGRRSGLIEQEESSPAVPQPSPHTGSGDDNITTAAGNVVEGGNELSDSHTPGSYPRPEEGSTGAAATEVPVDPFNPPEPTPLPGDPPPPPTVTVNPE